MSEKNLVIFRGGERWEYIRYAYFHLLDHTSPDAKIQIILNGNGQHWVKPASDLILQTENRRLRTYGRRIGGPNAINEGIMEGIKHWPSIENVFVVDEDSLVPLELHYPPEVIWWDEALEKMLDAGWKVAGHAWSPKFSEHDKIKEIGGTLGYAIANHVAGTCSGFRLATWKETRIPQKTFIDGYTRWMYQVGKGKVGYCVNPTMYSVHFDRPEHPRSQRDTTYKQWSDDMYYERFPERRNLNHPKHERPLGQEGVKASK